MLLFRVSIICLSIQLSACAYTNFIPIAPGDHITPGQRVYDNKPILLVSSNGMQIQFIKDPTRVYAVQFGAFLAKNDLDIKLDNGTITEINSKLDSTAVIELLKTIADKLLSSPLAKPVGGELVSGTPIAIYDFIFDDYGNIIELRPFKIPVPSSLVKRDPPAATTIPGPKFGQNETDAPAGKTTPRTGG